MTTVDKVTLRSGVQVDFYDTKDWNSLSEQERHDIEKRTLFGVLECVAIEKVVELREFILAGKLDGSSYWSDSAQCGCVLGVLSEKKTATYGDGYGSFSEQITDDADIERLQACGGTSLSPTGYSPIEELAWNVRRGDTPDDNETSALILSWVDEFLAAHK